MNYSNIMIENYIMESQMIQNYTALLEMYFGETDEIKSLFEAVSTARKKYIESGSDKGITADKNITHIGDVIADIFGFYDCDFKVLLDNTKNAWTYPVTYSLDVDTSKAVYTKKNTGYKFKKEFKLCTIIRVTSAVWMDSDFTDREIVGLILHEIGHNFMTAQNDELIIGTNNLKSCLLIESLMLVLCDIMQFKFEAAILDIKNVLQTTNFKKKLDARLSKIFGRENSKLGDVLDRFVFNLNNKFNGILDNILVKTGIDKLSLKFNKLFINFDIIKGDKIKDKNQLEKLYKKYNSGKSFGRGQETVSDSFANIYGYGPDLQSALMKMTLGKVEYSKARQEAMEKDPLYKQLIESQEFGYFKMVEVMSDHPGYAQRSARMITELKDELKKSDLSPKIRKELEENIKKMEALNKEIMTFKEKVNKKDPEMAKKLFVASMLELGDVELKEENKFTNMKSRDEKFDDLLEELCSSFE